MTSIAILIPVLGRPANASRVMNSIRENTTVPYRVLFIASRSDIDEIRELRRLRTDFIVTDFGQVGQYAKKINEGFRRTSEEFVFTGADDLEFHTGWDTAALAKMTDGVGVVGTQDLCNAFVKRGQHSTHSLVRRSYVEEFGVIDQPGHVLYEGYVHEYVDNELVETARARKAWAFANDAVVEHLHPTCGKAPADESYDKQPHRMNISRQLFRQRKQLWGAGRRVIPTVDVSVVVPTFGDKEWERLGELAAASANSQTHRPVEIIRVHGKTLAAARNEGAERATGTWLCFLDADDHLDYRYFEKMKPHMKPGRVLVPGVVEVLPEGKTRRKHFPTRPLDQGNWIVVGALVERERFLQVGFEEEWHHWEDWQMWRKVIHLGARPHRVPLAVYRVTWRPNSRHRTVVDPERERTMMQASFDRWAQGVTV